MLSIMRNSKSKNTQKAETVLLNDFTKFITLVQDQCNYGGQKYALSGSNTRESTDVLVSQFGVNWLYGTMSKYVKRFRNLARERDLLKIACYCFILWLKRGYHIKETGLSVDMLDTNLEQKTRNLPIFIDEVKLKCLAIHEQYKEGSLEVQLSSVDETLISWAREAQWGRVYSFTIYSVFYRVFLIWREKYANVESHDTDTGENDKK